MSSYGTAQNPDVLPPDAEFGPEPRQPVRRPRSPWSSAWATYLLVGVNCGVFLAMTLRGANPISPDPELLVRWGADNAGNVLILGEWWRVIAAMFLHVGIIHLAGNMWCLWNLGLLAEPLMGSFGLIAAYILTGAAGNLLSIAVNWIWPIRDSAGNILGYASGAGASGAVFGIAGALIVLLKSTRLPVPPQELKRLRSSVIYFAVINLVIGASIGFGSKLTGIHIDNMAHLGGVSSGLLFALPMVPRIGSSREQFDFRLRMAIGMIAGLLLLFCFFLKNLARVPG